ncbi:gluconokinase [Arthrobacter zhaoguopingii]|uniref:gluconokinase n=1 Tax=Arthrobacter zhaoguopingii TaxID=2681491 RepID=UPI001FEAC2B4|nr:gluconokinase [Arthrobacter zhaoguopingii]
MPNLQLPPVVVMGVQGSGKTTVGTLLAARLGADFVDGDDLHSEHNRKLMAAGTPLTDTERLPWLRAVGERLAQGGDSGIVVACSALKRSYRDLLRGLAPAVVMVHPHGPMEVVAERVANRRHQFMPPSLLVSQYEVLQTLQEDERGVTVDLSLPLEQIVDQAADYVRGRAAEEETPGQ